MSLKAKITKDEYEALADHFKGEYKASGDEYVLDVEGAEDPAELRRARDREKENAKNEKTAREAAEARAAAAEAKLNDGATADARKRGDIDALEKSWKDKHAQTEKDGKDAVKKVQDQMRTLLVRDKARELAESISTAPELILPHIESRMTAEFEGDMPTTRILDLDGKPSAATIDDLRKEIVATAKFAPIIKASSATGGGAGNGGGSGNGGGASGKKFGDLTERERIEFHNRDPEGFKKASAEHKAQLAKR